MAVVDGSTLVDGELLARVREGDTAAFGWLYQRYEPDARTLARYLTRSRHEVDDVVAEAFSKVLRAIRGGAGPTIGFRPYLLTAVRRTAWRRQEGQAKIVLDDDPAEHLMSLDVTDADGDDDGIACRAFHGLPPRWRTALWHTAIEGRSSAEVGELLGLSPNAAAALIGRAREGLRRAYLDALVVGEESEACHAAVRHLAADVRGGLCSREQDRVDAHLADCAACRDRRADVVHLNAALDRRPAAACGRP